MYVTTIKYEICLLEQCINEKWKINLVDALASFWAIVSKDSMNTVVLLAQHKFWTYIMVYDISKNTGIDVVSLFTTCRW